MSAQVCGIKLGPGDAGVAVGCVARVDGLRFNFRDRYLQQVRGVGVTIWRPYDESEGVVTGLAVGLPVTGAATLRGLALAAGIEVDQDFTGIALAPIGFRAADRVRGIVLSGVGTHASGNVDGLVLGGVGVGVEGRLRGIAIGGVGAGGGGSVRGPL